MGLKSLVASRIREARRLAKLTQQQAADLFGIGQTTWASWETGHVNIPLDSIDRIAVVLKQPVEFFTNANFEYTVKASVPEGTIKKSRTERRGAKQGAAG